MRSKCDCCGDEIDSKDLSYDGYCVTCLDVRTPGIDLFLRHVALRIHDRGIEITPDQLWEEVLDERDGFISKGIPATAGAILTCLVASPNDLVDFASRLQQQREVTD